jgi:hypothetical protein
MAHPLGGRLTGSEPDQNHDANHAIVKIVEL